ncbi:MAG TPA: hypothetical protein DCM87_20320 [Planctomycetes bacterium]|nr:hypothetical protein [Planctomycetota bacterium]
MQRGLLYACGAVVLAGLCTLFLGLSGCGGGGSGGTGTDGVQPATGTIAVVFADGPADEFEKIIIRVTRVSLLPENDEDHPVVIYSHREGYEINLLELRDEDLILTVNRDVPAGTYDKIRLHVAEVRGEGGPCDVLRLPSGKIDLNPRGPFRLAAGGSISVRLDIDVDKSIHIASNSRCNFRPVVFVDIQAGGTLWRCPRLLCGTIAELIDDGDDAPDGEIDGFMLELGSGRGTLEVRLGEDTAIFDAEGDAAGRDALAVGERVRVRGMLNYDGTLAASLVVVGDVMVVKGEALGAVDQDGLFAFRPATGEELTGDFDVLVQDQTLVIAGCDRSVSAALIKAGVKCRLVGKYAVGAAEFKAALVFVAPAELRGEITAITPAAELMGDWVTVRDAEGGETTFLLPAGAPVQLEGNGDVPRDFLCPGRRVRATFDLEAAGALRAEALYIDPDKLAGEVAEIEPERVLVLASGERIHVGLDATILDQRGDADELVAFEAIVEGAYIEAFALTPCSGDEYEGFVILITEPAIPL